MPPGVRGRAGPPKGGLAFESEAKANNPKAAISRRRYRRIVRVVEDLDGVRPQVIRELTADALLT